MLSLDLGFGEQATICKRMDGSEEVAFWHLSDKIPCVSKSTLVAFLKFSLVGSWMWCAEHLLENRWWWEVACNDKQNKSLHYLPLFGKYCDTDHILGISEFITCYTYYKES